MSQRTLAFLCFFFSGSTGLMYEVVWTRLLGGVIGNTHFSITLVVSVFMGGLALGSFIGGRVADKSPNPLRLYGILVLCVGAGCLLVPAAVLAARPIFGWLYQFYDGVPEATPLLAARIFFSALVLLIPTSFMGATLPALSRHLTRSLKDVGGTIGGLYTINTFGAVAGTVFTGFAGIRFLGIWGSTGLAVAIDVAIGFIVLAASRGATAAVGPAAPGPKAEYDSSTIRPAARLPGQVRLALLAFGGVGFADMLLQIAWTKAIVLSIGNSTYAFSLIVTLFILGIAIGGGLVSLFVDRVKNLPFVLGALIFLTAVLVSATIPLLGDYPVIAARWFDQIENPSYGKFLAAHVALVSAVILPSTILMGTVFPIVGKIRTEAVESVGSAVGSAYFWNTLGSILGTLAAGFVFIPLFGKVYYTLYLGAGISLFLGTALIFVSSRGQLGFRTALAGGLVALVLMPHAFLLPQGVFGSTSHFWHPSLLSRGAYVYYKSAYYNAARGVIPRGDFVNGVIAENQVLLYKEGIHAPVAVVKNRKGEMAMRISGKVEASLAPGGSYNTDLPHQVLAGHLPMILHPAPKHVLTLGLGGGVTLGTLTLYPVESIDSLEISPEVIEAARDFFFEANHHALTNPKVRNVVGDGRNHLEYTARKYDVITSVPSNPWIAGIGNLFTVEFFRTCRGRLADGGIICNWIHKINMRGEDFQTVVRTFLEVFGDHAQMWDLGFDALLIGSLVPVQFNASRLEGLLKSPEIAGDLSGLGISSPATFLRHYQLDAAAMRRFAGERGPLNTDAFPVLEFSCPYGLYGHPFDTFDAITFLECSDLSQAWISGLDSGLEHARAVRGAFRRYLEAQSRYSHLSADASTYASRTRAASPEAQHAMYQAAMQILEDLKAIEATTRDGSDPWLQAHANELAVTAMGVSQQPSLAATLCAGLTMYAGKAKTPEERLAYLEQASTYAPDAGHAAVEIGRQYLELKQPAKGIPVLAAALSKMPDDARILQTLGILQTAGGRADEGLETLARALTHARDAAQRSEIHQNIGFAHQLTQRAADAIREYEQAIAENPANSEAKARLEQLRKQVGQ